MKSDVLNPKKWIRQLISCMGYELRHKGRLLSNGSGLPPDFDAETARIIDAVRPYTTTSPERIWALHSSIRYLVRAGIEGAFVECGVWRGGSVMAMAMTLIGLGVRDRELYLFDTFEGMTPASDVDRNIFGQNAAELMVSTTRSTNELNVWCYSPLETVRKTVCGTGYISERIHFIRGRVEETLPENAPERIALLRLDTDWYQSTYHELAHLYPRLVQGGILIIDDYGCWEGARKAVDQYIEKNSLRLYLSRIDYTARLAVKLHE